MSHQLPKNIKVTVVVPVYGDWLSLKECINSLKKHLNSNLHQVMLINDCGPDADVLEANIKKAIGGKKNFEYYRNVENIGFVKTCNRAVLKLDKTGNDILLLNSDTKVTKGFLEAMLAVLHSSPQIGAVCPRSNNATVFSVPIEAQVKDYSMEQSYKLYKRLKRRLPIFYESPVAHGFCMLIKRDVIKQYGLFDEAYGKGYGEENDFCMRIRKQGYICAAANHAFVFHFRARSFTPEKREELVQKNEKILKKRYPEYDSLVKDYLDNTLDPIEWQANSGEFNGPKSRTLVRRLFRV